MISKKKFTTNTKVIVIWETFVGKRVRETNQNNIELEHEKKKQIGVVCGSSSSGGVWYIYKRSLLAGSSSIFKKRNDPNPPVRTFFYKTKQENKNMYKEKRKKVIGQQTPF